MKGFATTIAVSAIVLLMAAYAVYAREKPRPGHEVITAAEARQAQLNGALDELKSHPVLAPLDTSWNDIRFLLESCAVEVHPVAPDPATPDAQRLYSGPVPAWHANINAKSPALFSCLDAANKLDSIYIGTIALDESGGRASISVLGRLTDKQWSSP